MTKKTSKPEVSLPEINDLQQQLIAAQQEVIRLHQKIEQLNPPKPDANFQWHKTSNGKLSEDVIKSDDLASVQSYYEWLLGFGAKYIKPYVHLEVYAELVSHLTRGITRKLAELEVQADIAKIEADVEAETQQTVPRSPKNPFDQANQSASKNQPE